MRWISYVKGLGARLDRKTRSAYQIEGYDMFEEMIRSIQVNNYPHLFHVTVETDTQRKQVIKVTQTSGGEPEPQNLL